MKTEIHDPEALGKVIAEAEPKQQSEILNAWVQEMVGWPHTEPHISPTERQACHVNRLLTPETRTFLANILAFEAIEG